MSKSGTEFHIQTLLHGLQVVILLLGVAAVFTTIGKKDQIITSTAQNMAELESIVHDLVKTQVAGVTKDVEHDRVLIELKGRIYRLEQGQ
tara:strand:+ start:114 stop:383 length:270 start_codon:yes stop_codon:yes gene_type:complete